VTAVPLIHHYHEAAPENRGGFFISALPVQGRQWWVVNEPVKSFAGIPGIKAGQSISVLAPPSELRGGIFVQSTVIVTLDVFQDRGCVCVERNKGFDFFLGNNEFYADQGFPGLRRPGRSNHSLRRVM
jgi:hypothetical protein